jgi:hypothetical protein
MEQTNAALPRFIAGYKKQPQQSLLKNGHVSRLSVVFAFLLFFSCDAILTPI